MALSPGRTTAKPRGRRILTVMFAITIVFAAIGILGYQRSRSKSRRAYANSDVVRTVADDAGQGVGDVQVRTLPFAEGAAVTRASYSFSGRVIVSYRDGSDNVTCTLDDDGTDVPEVYRGTGSVSSRLLPYRDNTHILLGDAVLECPEGVWVYNSPMSWRAEGRSALWMERDRDGSHVRVQIVDLLDYEPGQAVQAVATPRVGDYATAPEGLGTYRVVVAGAYSGTATIAKETGFLGRSTVTITYDGYSDDGQRFYQGMETSSASMMSKTTYESDLVVTDVGGKRVGGMDVHLVLGAAVMCAKSFRTNKSPTSRKRRVNTTHLIC